MCCYGDKQQRRLRERRAQRRLDAARLANYKPLYLAARAARDYLKKGTPTENQALVAQLDATLIDPHLRQEQEK
jgi:hypothetical protein